jgi:archaellum biogenesis protein FlaJ (TadC family)
MDWVKIFSAILIVGWIIFMWPRAKYWMQNSPKAKKGDWQAAILPLAGVVGFVILLIMLV